MYNILTGNAKEVQDQLNSKVHYNKKVDIISMTSTDNQTTLLIKVTK